MTLSNTDISGIFEHTKKNLLKNPNGIKYEGRHLERSKKSITTHKIQVRQEVMRPHRIDLVTVQSLQIKTDKDNQVISTELLDCEGGIFLSSETTPSKKIIAIFLSLAEEKKKWKMRPDFADPPRKKYLSKTREQGIKPTLG